MKKILLAATVLVVYSCTNKNDYSYVEIVDEENLSGSIEEKKEDPKIIEAESDSIAYMEAFQKFVISQKVQADMKAAGQKIYKRTKAFQLYNEEGADISNITFIGKDSLMETTMASIMERESIIKSSGGQKAASEVAAVDKDKIKELMPHFRFKKDEYTNENTGFFIPKSAPNFVNANALYIYFGTTNDVPDNLRFRLQYYSEDWLFISNVQFLIDGKAYEYSPLEVKSDVGDGGHIWEWFDDGVSYGTYDLVQALANAKTAKMKINGRQYNKEKIISSKQISSIKRTLELYKAMGGKTY